MNDLKHKTIRGGFAKLCSQGTSFVLRMGSLMVLARLLDPKDFGLVGMVTAVIGVLNLFKDFGLSTATVQSTTVTEEQLSTLFWINILVGVILTGVSLVGAPFIASFYHEPRLVWVTVALASGFLLNAAGVQHSAILQRHMRFTALATIDIVSLVISTAVGIAMAVMGYKYWALVGMALSSTAISTVAIWFTSRWLPGMPRRNAGVRSMMGFGSTVTLNGLVVYIAYNLEKVLIGRFWGPEVIGIYGRGYQLVNIPTDNLNSAVGTVAFSALSRVKDDPGRLRSFFLKGYSLVLGLTVPITLMCALFAPDIVAVLLGAKWAAVVPIFRFLAPTILIFALINPMSWLLTSTGRVSRSLKIAFVIAPLVITGDLIGLHYGPTAVAFAYSSVMTLWLVPHILWSISGTGISFWDIVHTARRPIVSSIMAGLAAWGVQALCGNGLSHIVRLLLEGTTLVAVYVPMLLYVMDQKALYSDVIRGLLKPAPLQDKAAAASAY